MFGLSTGDLIAFAGVIVVAIYNFTSLVSQFLKHRDDEAIAEAVTVKDVASLSKAIARAFNEIAELSRQYRAHELDCAKFRGEILSFQTTHKETSERIERAIAQLQSQVRFRAAGASDRAMMLPSSSDTPPEG